jgi:1,2-diacylglycerol 3-alpha-glucosyltransferase
MRNSVPPGPGNGLKIVVASSGLGHVARGIEAWAADLARALVARGRSVLLCKGGGRAEAEHERVVACWPREADRTRRLLALVPRGVGWRLGMGSPYGVEQATFALGLLGLLRRERADILHVQDPLVALIAQRARRMGLIRARTILAHGTEEPPAFLAKIEFLQHLAPWHLEEARAAGAWRPAWTAIPNFIDTDRFRPGRADSIRRELGIPARAQVVLSAAAIKRGHKRVDHLIGEFAALLDRDPSRAAYLVVAGGWEAETDELVEQGRARLGDRVRFLIRHPRERMPELYRAADAFVLCSLKEMMPIALLEATASGLPCLVHRHPVLEWVVAAGGEAIDMEAPGRLAAAIGRSLDDAAGLRHAGERARRHCLDQFGRDAVVDRILDYYRQVHRAGCPGGALPEVTGGYAVP